MRPWSPVYAGRLDQGEITSAALEGNHLGDSATRPIYVYLPPGYDEDPGRRYPAVYVLQGFFGALPAWLLPQNNLRATYPEMADELFSSGEAPPCILVFVDAWTRLGGSQFVDSPGTGDYQRYLCEDVVDYVDARYRTLPQPQSRALQGKSSGGYGAMVNAMTRPDVFGAFATHAGDARFDLLMMPELAAAHRALRDHYGGSFEAFLADHATRPALSKASDSTLAIVYAMAACFSAAEDGTPLLPFEPATGQLVDAVWARWTENDPVQMVAGHADALAAQRAIWVDAGRSDDYLLDLGAEAFVAELAAIGIDDVAFELFDGTHRAIEYRYPLALSYLSSRLARD